MLARMYKIRKKKSKIILPLMKNKSKATIYDFINQYKEIKSKVDMNAYIHYFTSLINFG